MTYEIVIPARNEEKYLRSTLLSIKNQSIPPNRIIVVNDGSIDGTLEIANSLANVIINLPDRGHTALGSTEIVKVFNKGLEKISVNTDYVLICGADDVLPKNYVEVILTEMKRDPKLVIISGSIKGDPVYVDALPRGTRIVKTFFWRSINDMQYPQVFGWESWLVYKALQMGYRVKRIPHLYIKSQRHPIEGALKRAYTKGIAMRLLGYGWFSMFGRAFRYFLLKPDSGIKMISGFIYARKIPLLDVAYWVNRNQKIQFFKKIRIYLKFILKRSKF